LTTARMRFMVACVTDDIDYSVTGPLTGLATISREALERIPDEPVDICRPAHSRSSTPMMPSLWGSLTTASPRTRSGLLPP